MGYLPYLCRISSINSTVAFILEQSAWGCRWSATPTKGGSHVPPRKSSDCFWSIMVDPSARICFLQQKTLDWRYKLLHPPKTNMDTQNHGLEKVAPALNMAHFLVISVKFSRVIFHHSDFRSFFKASLRDLAKEDPRFGGGSLVVVIYECFHSGRRSFKWKHPPFGGEPTWCKYI